MTSHFGCHIMRSFDAGAGIIVIVENCGGFSVSNGKAQLRDTLAKIPEIDNLFGNGASGTNLSLAGAQGGTVLALAKPSNWATIAENNAAIHASKLE